MSSDFKGRVYKKVCVFFLQNCKACVQLTCVFWQIEASDSLMMIYQVRGYNHFRLSPREICRGHCPELGGTLREGEICKI
jgi:hypothetical protein